MGINEIRSALMLFAVLALAPMPSLATGAALEATYNTSISNGWARVERWRDPGSAFTQETFPPDGRGNQSGQRVTFFNGIATPHSSRQIRNTRIVLPTAAETPTELLAQLPPRNAPLALNELAARRANAIIRQWQIHAGY